MLEKNRSIWSRLGFNGKMVVRNLFRNKIRTFMSFIGVLSCTSLLITSLGLQDSVEFFVGKYYYGTVQYDLRADLEPGAGTVESYRKRIPAGTLEGVMETSVSIRSRDRARTTVLTVMEDGQRLMHFGKDEQWTPLPENGVMLTQKLAQAIGVSVGDRVEIWLPGDDEPVVTVVGGIAWVTVGQSAIISRSLWEQCRKSAFTPTSLYLKDVPPEGLDWLERMDELDELLDPDQQYLDMLKILDSLSQIFLLMSVAALGLAFVVLYNMGRLNYMERYREYATLKVLGYHQREIRGLIRAENNLITLAGLALGLWPGRQLTELVLRSCESDTMAFASTVEPRSYVIAVVVTYLFSWLITRLLSSKVKNVDMVEALKSVE